MPAPNLTFTHSGTVLSGHPGYDVITVQFSADRPLLRFECRATREGAAYGVGVGELLASFSATPAGIQRTFEIYDEYLTQGDGRYRISLFAQGEDGSWNDNAGFITADGSTLYTVDGAAFLAMRG